MKIEPGRVYYFGASRDDVYPVQIETLDFGDGKDAILVLRGDLPTEDIDQFGNQISDEFERLGIKSLFVYLPEGATLEWIRRPS